MKTSKRLALVLALLTLLACGAVGLVAACGDRTTPQEQTEWIETEDCDAEDWAHYEAECHRSSPKPQVTKTKMVLAPTPVPRKTRR